MKKSNHLRMLHCDLLVLAVWAVVVYLGQGMHFVLSLIVSLYSPIIQAIQRLLYRDLRYPGLHTELENVKI